MYQSTVMNLRGGALDQEIEIGIDITETKRIGTEKEVGAEATIEKGGEDQHHLLREEESNHLAVMTSTTLTPIPSQSQSRL